MQKAKTVSSRKSTPTRQVIGIALLLIAVAVGVWGVSQNPLFQKWRLSRMSLAAIEQERNTDPENPRLLYYSGLRLIEQKRYADSLPFLTQAALHQPDDSGIRDALAQAQIAQGQTQDAFNQLKQFAGTHPNLPEAHLLLGRFYLLMKAGKRAKAELQQSVTLDPNFAPGWATFADALAEFSPDQAAARSAAERAVKLRPDIALNQLRLATLLAHLRDPAARSAFEKAIALSPKRSDVHYDFADYLLTTGNPTDIPRAEREARTALAINPDAPVALFALGQSLQLRGANRDAIEPLKRAAALDPDNPAPPHTLANLLAKQGQSTESRTWNAEWQKRQNYKEARRQLLLAIVVNPEDRARSLRLAHLIGRHGEVEEAMRYHALALGTTPDAPAVLLETAKDLVAGGHRADAVPILQRALNSVPPTSPMGKAVRQWMVETGIR